MVASVGGVNTPNLINLYAQKHLSVTNPATQKSNKNELPVVTKESNVSIPQSYQKLGVDKLENGQEIHSYKLANGQKILIAPMESPSVNISTYVNGGILDEEKGQRGTRHLIEHLLFNDKSGNNKIKPMLDKIGGSSNGATNPNVTFYSLNVPLFEDSDFEKGIALESDMFKNPDFTNENLSKEKNIIKSEINLTKDEKYYNKFLPVTNFYNLNEGNKDYILGEEKDVDAISLNNVRDYYNKMYTPDNMTTVITGNIKPDDAINLVSKHFNMQINKNPKSQNPIGSTLSKTTRQDIINPNNSDITISQLCFEGPTHNNTKENIALEGVFNYLKTTNDNITGTFNSATLNPSDKNIIAIYNFSKQNSEKNLKNTLTAVKNFPILSKNELINIKRDIKEAHQENLENPEKFNIELGLNSFADSEYIKKYNNIVDSLTAEDLKNVANKYLNTEKCSICVTHPKGTTQEHLMQEYKEANISQKIPFNGLKKIYHSENIETEKLNNNINLAFYDKPNSQTINLNMLYRPMEKIDSPLGCREVVNKIFENLKSSEFDLKNKNIDILVKPNDAISILGSLNIDKTSNVYNFINQAMDIGVGLDNKTLQEYKNLTKNDLLTKKEDSLNIAIKNAANIPSNEIIAKNIDNITTVDIKKYLADIQNCSALSVGIVGPKAQVKGAAINNFSKYQNVKPQDFHLSETYKEQQTPNIIIKEQNMNQADITQSYKYKISGNIKDTVTFDLLNNILNNGSENGIFNNLRENNKLAYDVSTFNTQLGNTGCMNCNIKTDIDNDSSNIKKSINGFNKQINQLKNGNVTDDELQVAKKQIKQKILNASYYKSDIAQNLIDGINSPYGADLVNKKLDIVDTINPADITTAAKYVFSNNPTYAIIASKSSIEQNKDFLNSLRK